MINEENLKDKNINYEICVYGGGIDSNSKREHDPPHFHVITNEKEIRYLIPLVDDFYNIKKLEVCKGDLDDLYINNVVFYWLNLNNKKQERILNIENIRLNWNRLNKKNNLTTKLRKVYQSEATDTSNIGFVEDIEENIDKLAMFDIIIRGSKDYLKNNKESIKSPHFFIRYINSDKENKILIPNIKEFMDDNEISSAENYNFFNNSNKYIKNELIKYFSDHNNIIKLGNK